MTKTMNTTDCFSTIEDRFRDWHYDHPKILYGLIRSLRPSIVVEVGTYQGYAACYMARALQENKQGHLICIDNFSMTTQQRFTPADWEANLTACGVRGLATLKIGQSDNESIWPEGPQSVDFAYIDGWHSLKVCMADFRRAAARGAEVIALDDVIHTLGPRFVVEELRRIGIGWDIVEVHRDAGLALCFRKKPKVAATFSQELDGHTGVDLKGMTREEVRGHIREASARNGVNYAVYD